MKTFQWWCFNICSILWVSCQNSSHNKGLGLGQKTELQYAQNFNIEKGENSTIITIYEPGSNQKIFLTYYLYSGEKPQNTLGADVVMKVPVKSVAALSTTHIGFLDALNEIPSVTGITDPFRVYNKAINKSFSEGRIQGLGDSMDPNIEKLFMLSPDLIFKSAFENIKAQDKRLLQAKVPVAYSYSWKENSILARMEWIKFFACFFQKEALADSIFNKACLQYDSLKTMVKTHKLDKPQVIAGSSFKGTWYVPGGASYIAAMIKDAGGQYLFQNDASVGSLAVGIETIYQNGKNADFWVNGGDESVMIHAASDARMHDFKPIVNGNMYTQNRATTAAGGNAYWESGIVHPQWILADLIKMFHPELLPNYELKYYKKVILPE